MRGVDRVDGVEIDRQGHLAPVGQGRADPVGVRDKGAEAADPVEHAGVAGVKQMRPVGVHADAVRIDAVVSVAADVRTLVHDGDTIARLRQGACMDGAGKTGAHDQH